MVDRLRVDTSTLVQAGTALRIVAEEFAAANHRSDDVADAVGHGPLAGAVRAFAHDWDTRRGKMLDEIAALSRATTGIGAGFEEIDRALGRALLGENPA